MRKPGWFVTGTAVIALLLLATPIVGLLTRTPWADFPTLLARPDVAQALQLSLVTSLIATVVVVLLGVPLALLLAGSRGWWTGPARAVCALPLVLPPVAGGMALMAAFGRTGLVGAPLGLAIPFTPPAVVLAQVFVSLPYFVLTLEGGLRQDLQSLEEAAETMGAARWQVLRYVTLPIVAPALVAGAVLSWTRALGEFGATITFAGNLPGRTQTLSLAVYLAAQHDMPAAYALATVLVLVSGGLLLLVQVPMLGRSQS